jgi:hypothetical protein
MDGLATMIHLLALRIALKVHMLIIILDFACWNVLELKSSLLINRPCNVFQNAQLIPMEMIRTGLAYLTALHLFLAIN